MPTWPSPLLTGFAALLLVLTLPIAVFGVVVAVNPDLGPVYPDGANGIGAMLTVIWLGALWVFVRRRRRRVAAFALPGDRRLLWGVILGAPAYVLFSAFFAFFYLWWTSGTG